MILPKAEKTAGSFEAKDIQKTQKKKKIFFLVLTEKYKIMLHIECEPQIVVRLADQLEGRR